MCIKGQMMCGRTTCAVLHSSKNLHGFQSVPELNQVSPSFVWLLSMVAPWPRLLAEMVVLVLGCLINLITNEATLTVCRVEADGTKVSVHLIQGSCCHQSVLSSRTSSEPFPTGILKCFRTELTRRAPPQWFFCHCFKYSVRLDKL